MSAFEQRPVRVLHVVGGMNLGGVETWLVHLLRHTDRACFQMEFLVHTADPCDYDDEIQTTGSKVIRCPHHKRPAVYARTFERILREHGPYDVVHSHVHHYGGYVLRLAHQAGVRVRIAHSHSGNSTRQEQASLLRGVYLCLMKRLVYLHATVGLAASRKAAVALFGPDWSADGRWRILYCGIDLAPFERTPNPSVVRAEFGIPDDALVVGHVGRFAEPKNHRFLVDIYAEVVRREPRAWLLLVGDGPQRTAIERVVARKGLAERVTFAGLRHDVPRLMSGAMHVFVLPSLYEGLPMVGIEAQAAGLPLVLSDAITEELDVVKPLVRRRALSDPPSSWAQALLTAWDTVSVVPRASALSILRESPFNIARSVKLVEQVYDVRQQ
jgi:glycosyltransferase involved in cell wall biosynthesis